MKLKFAGFLLIAAITVVSMFSSCKKTETATPTDKNLAINTFIHKYMRTDKWYLWYDLAPEVAPNSSAPSDYLNSLLYTKLDKWSFVIDSTTYNSLVGGNYYGYGFSYRWHIDNTLRVSVVFAGSPMDKAGVKRGYEITQINGKKVSYIQNNGLWGSIFGDDAVGVSTTFTIKDDAGNVLTKTLQKASVTQNSVFNEKVFTDVNGVNVGYLYFHTFMTNSGMTELMTAFADFKSKNVKRLVIDLRYNGGGSLSTALGFGDLIKGADKPSSPFVTLQYNSYHTDYNEVGNFATATQISTSLPQSLSGVDKVIFITTPSTASASEVMINCLKPYVDVKVVGDVTDGKPVGMDTQLDKATGMYLFAITFKDVNALGAGDFYSGITPDSYCYDGLNKDFGDPEENCLKQALYYLKNGMFDNSILFKKGVIAYPQPEFKGAQRFYSAF